MIIAALDTSCGIAFAIKQDDEILLDLYIAQNRGTLESLPKIMVEELLRINLDIAEIDLWLIGIGPGSFTGIRIGIAFVQGICAVTNKNYYGISTSIALANATKNENINSKKIGVCYDGRRSEVLFEVYENEDCGIFQKNNKNWKMIEQKVLDNNSFEENFNKVDILVANNFPAMREFAKNYAGKLMLVEKISAVNLIIEKDFDFSKSAESCDPVYIRPAVFIEPQKIRIIE